MVQDISCPKFPTWAENIDLDSYDQLTEIVANQLSLFINARNGDSRSASEIGARYENGSMFDSPDIGEAIIWYVYSANLGDASAALRAAQLRHYIKEYKTDKLVIDLEVLAISNALKGVTKESLCVAMSAAEMLLDKECDPPTLELINKLLQESKLHEHPSSDKVLRKFRQSLAAKGAHTPSLKIALNKITGDSDFKPGIYKVLESPLPLIETPENPDQIKITLDTEFPWFSEVNEIVHRQLVCSLLSKLSCFKLRPLLLAGPPGIGKTHYAKRLAELCNIPFRMIMAAGNADSMSLRGLSRGWGSARPGIVLQTMAIEGTANPLFMIDELDKSSPSSQNGRIWDVLLQLIEPATSKIYLDECLQVPCNLSMVSWIATANQLSDLPKPLIERFTVILVNAPGEEHFESLIKTVISSFARELDIDIRMLPSLSHYDLQILRKCKNPREINRTYRILIEKKLVIQCSKSAIN